MLSVCAIFFALNDGNKTDNVLRNEKKTSVDSAHTVCLHYVCIINKIRHQTRNITQKCEVHQLLSVKVQRVL